MKYQFRGGLIPSLRKRLYHLPFIMKFYGFLFVILPALALASPVDAPYLAYVDETMQLLQADAPVAPPTSPKTAITEVLEPKSAPCEEIEGIEAKTACFAEKYGVNADELLSIMKCESSLNPNAKNVNSRESSWGLSQINILAHDVTVKEATDPNFAIEFLAKHWKDGKRHMWKNCSRKLGLL